MITKLTNRTPFNNFTDKCFSSLLTLTPLIILNVFLFFFITPLQAKTISTLTKEVFSELHQCDKKFEYDIYFFNRKVGYLHRKIKWYNSETTTKATVTSYGEVSFLWLESTYQQKSSMQYSFQYHHFLTPRFSQKLTGIKSREMEADIADNGLSSTVTLNNEVSHYQHKGENKNQALYDIDTLGAQIRLNLLQGKTRFKLSRQASNKIENYQFEVAGNEAIIHDKWGKLTAIKVIEIGEHENMVLWFSSKHDHQLIKAELDMVFSPIVWLSHFSQQC